MYFNAKETRPMIHLVINPTAGAGRATRMGDRVIAALQEKKIPFTAVHTAFAGEGKALARQAAQAGRKHIGELGQHKRAKHKPGPSRSCGIGDQRYAQGCDQAAQKIVANFPAGHRVQRAAGRAPLRRKDRKHVGQ